MYEMMWWEILLTIQGYRRRNVLQYQLQRIQAWASALCMGNKEGKQPLDLIDLYFDHYIEEGEEQLTKEEQDEILAEIRAEYERIAAEQQK
jgi:hypothetical protein